jgi:diketogulonate reductase-like aldo/keto reductase
VLLKWNLQRGVPVVAKASSEAHMRANLEGMTSWKLSNQAKVELDTLECAKRFVNFEWHAWPSAEEGGITKPSTVRDKL